MIEKEILDFINLYNVVGAFILIYILVSLFLIGFGCVEYNNQSIKKREREKKLNEDLDMLAEIREIIKEELRNNDNN